MHACRDSAGHRCRVTRDRLGGGSLTWRRGTTWCHMWCHSHGVAEACGSCPTETLLTLWPPLLVAGHESPYRDMMYACHVTRDCVDGLTRCLKVDGLQAGSITRVKTGLGRLPLGAAPVERQASARASCPNTPCSATALRTRSNLRPAEAPRTCFHGIFQYCCSVDLSELVAV